MTLPALTALLAVLAWPVVVLVVVVLLRKRWLAGLRIQNCHFWRIFSIATEARQPIGSYYAVVMC